MSVTIYPKISVISSMLTMMNQAGVAFLPYLPGLPLLPETGDPQTTLENVRRISKGRSIVAIIVGPAGVGLGWGTGETLAATGFAVGGGPKTEALAQALSEMGCGPYDALLKQYSALPAGYRGHLPCGDCTKDPADRLLPFWQEPR
jgi:hypothetical protein